MPNVSTGQFLWADNASLSVRSSATASEAILRINVDTGQTTVVISGKSPEILQQMRVAAPGRLQYFRSLPTIKRFVELDVASGVETELLALRGWYANVSCVQLAGSDEKCTSVVL